MSSKITDNKETWTCPYPDPEGHYPRCDFRGGIPTVEPGSTRSASCLPCQGNKVSMGLLAILRVFHDLFS